MKCASSERVFQDLLQKRWEKGTCLVVGLDSDYDQLSDQCRGSSVAESIFWFNRQIIDATYDLVCAYKLNMAFYLQEGVEGMMALLKTILYVHHVCHDIPVILDGKWGDVPNTNKAYAKAVFDYYKADAITVNPYVGGKALQPFLERKNKGIIVLCRTSNEGAGEFQDLHTLSFDLRDKPEKYTNEEWLSFCQGPIPLYQRVVFHVAELWNTNHNCSVVVGATYPEEARLIREIAPKLPFLIPGVGVQTAEQETDLEATILASRDGEQLGMMVNASRSIIFASSGPDFARAAEREARRLRDAINKYREKK